MDENNSSKFVANDGKESLGYSELCNQALPVARLADIDLNSPPTSGEDYLTRVR